MAYIAEQGRGLVVMLGGWESPDTIMRNIAQLAGTADVEAPRRIIGLLAQVRRCSAPWRHQHESHVSAH